MATLTQSAIAQPGTQRPDRTGLPASSGPRQRRPRRGMLGGFVLWACILALLVPFILAILTAFRPSSEVAAQPIGWPQHWTMENISKVFVQLDYGRSVLNTILILAVSSLVIVVCGAMAAYPLSRITRGWTGLAYRLFIVGTTIPIYVLLAPLYLLVRDLHLLNSHISVILIYAGMNLPISVFFYTSFLRQVPVELEEAAAIDGAGPIRTFFTIVFPLLSPVVATLVTYLSLAIWNDLVVPLVFLQGVDNRTIMANAYALINPNIVDPTVLFPAALLGVVPLILVFSFLQRYVVAGMSAGAVKA